MRHVSTKRRRPISPARDDEASSTLDSLPERRITEEEEEEEEEKEEEKKERSCCRVAT